MLEQYRKEYPWVNRDKINYHYKKYKSDSTVSAVSVSVIDSESVEKHSHTSSGGGNTSKASRIGRPKGSTKASKFLLKTTLTAAKNEIAQQYFEAKAKASSQGMKLGDGWLARLISDTKKKRGLDENIIIPLNTIRNRTKSIVLHPGR